MQSAISVYIGHSSIEESMKKLLSQRENDYAISCDQRGPGSDLLSFETISQAYTLGFMLRIRFTYKIEQRAITQAIQSYGSCVHNLSLITSIDLRSFIIISLIL